MGNTRRMQPTDCGDVVQHFTDWIDDQFDFHTYCLRKMTMRAYVGLLRLEDKYAIMPYQFKRYVHHQLTPACIAASIRTNTSRARHRA